MRRLFCPSALLVLGGLLTALALAGPGFSADETATATAAGSKSPVTGFVAYYFHGNLRCETCRTLEAYSEEAISQGFPDELASGRLAWRVVNVDEAENKHFVDDFQLVTKSLVLVSYQDGKVARFVNLAKIWQLVHDKDGFLEYVRDATRELIGAS